MYKKKFYVILRDLNEYKGNLRDLGTLMNIKGFKEILRETKDFEGFEGF